MGADTWTVSGLSFAVTAATLVRDTIALGDFVEVEATSPPAAH